MAKAPDTLVGKSIEWTGVHHSEHSDFTDLSTSLVTYETEETCCVTADRKLTGEARYTYKKLDDRMAIVIFRPEQYHGRSDVIIYAMFDFAEAKTRAVILAGGNHSRPPTAAWVATPPLPHGPRLR
jgi:hypothetical protein